MKNQILRSAVLLTLAALAVMFLWRPGKTQASGESYYFQDSTYQTIVGTGGAYLNATTYTATGPNAYHAQLNYSCNNQQYTLSLNLTTTGATPPATFPVSGTLAYDTSTVGCTVTDTFDKTINIAQDQNSVGQTATNQSADANKCDQGSLNWIVCPMLDSIDKFAANVANLFLPPMLKINPLSSSSAPGIYSAWAGMRDLANSLLVVAFILIILANVASFGLDSYTARKMLPRLVMAAILIQVSFFISSVIIDSGNVLGGGIQSLVYNFADKSGTHFAQSAQAGIFNLLGLGAGISLALIFWPMAIPLALSFLISILAIFLTLGARFLIIYALIVVSPLAFVAWLLPNTSAYFKKWWQTFIRLILMYPIIVAIIAIAGRTNELLGSANQLAGSGFADFSINVLKLVVAIAVFLMVPRTFKWAGGMMASVSGVINNFAGGRQKALRDSQWWKDSRARTNVNQLARMNRLANNRAVTGLTHSRSRLARGVGGFALGTAGVLSGGAPSTSLARQRAYSSQMNTYFKELEDLQEANIPNVKSALTAIYSNDPHEVEEARKQLSQNAPSLFRYINSQAGKIALVKKLDKPGLIDRKLMDNIRRNSPGDYILARDVASDTFPKKPVLLARFGQGEVDSNGVRHDHAGDIDAGTMGSIVGGLSAKKIQDDFHQENFEIARDNADAAHIIATRMGSGNLAQTFTNNTASYMDPNKRRAVMDMFFAQQATFMATPNGRRMIGDVLDRLHTNTDILDDYAQRAGMAPALAIDPNTPEADKVQAIRDYFGL